MTITYNINLQSLGKRFIEPQRGCGSLYFLSLKQIESLSWPRINIVLTGSEVRWKFPSLGPFTVSHTHLIIITGLARRRSLPPPFLSLITLECIPEVALMSCLPHSRNDIRWAKDIRLADNTFPQL